MQGSWDGDETIVDGEDNMSAIVLAQALAYESNTKLVKGLHKNPRCAKNGSFQTGYL
jgi:hypothetical protein